MAPPKPTLAIGGSPVMGSKNAKVQIFEFSDFQCPFCSKALEPVKQIEQAYGDKVAIVFKQYPLPF
ncbi:MAG: thioredoxin domain-containing protein, partial [Deltaproteobacteria bacterium]|nr:thioredoxin domain-containing protein [Deltaproteobacteria bacterium]